MTEKLPRVKMGCELGEVVPRKRLEGLCLEDVDSPSGKHRQDDGRRNGAVRGGEVPGTRQGQGEEGATGVAGICPGLGNAAGCSWPLPRLSPSGTKRGQRCLHFSLSERLRVSNSVD